MILQKSLNGQYTWKWVLMLILAKKSQELLFSEKTGSKLYPSLNCNDKLQKHPGLFLDPKLSFHEHIQRILNKIFQITRLIRKLQPIMPRAVFQQFLSFSFDLTLIMKIFFMVLPLTNISKMSYSLFNMMPH